MSEHEGRVAVVSGASQGIGRFLALDLARKGARVMALARSRESREETAALAADAAGSMEPVECDVADLTQVAHAAELILGKAKRVDFLINNAGITRDGLLLRMKEPDWDAVLATTAADFNEFGDVLARLNDVGRVVVLGSKDAIEAANTARGGWLDVVPVR